MQLLGIPIKTGVNSVHVVRNFGIWIWACIHITEPYEEESWCCKMRWKCHIIWVDKCPNVAKAV